MEVKKGEQLAVWMSKERQIKHLEISTLQITTSLLSSTLWVTGQICLCWNSPKACGTEGLGKKARWAIPQHPTIVLVKCVMFPRAKQELKQAWALLACCLLPLQVWLLWHLGLQCGNMVLVPGKATPLPISWATWGAALNVTYHGLDMVGLNFSDVDCHRNWLTSNLLLQSLTVYIMGRIKLIYCILMLKIFRKHSVSVKQFIIH